MPKRSSSKAKPKRTTAEVRKLLRQVGYLSAQLRSRDRRVEELRRRETDGQLTVEWDTHRTDLGNLTLVELRELAAIGRDGATRSPRLYEANA